MSDTPRDPSERPERPDPQERPERPDPQERPEPAVQPDRPPTETLGVGPYLFEGLQARDESAPDQRGGPGPADSPQRAWRRLLRAGSPRATRANVLGMV